MRKEKEGRKEGRKDWREGGGGRGGREGGLGVHNKHTYIHVQRSLKGGLTFVSKRGNSARGNTNIRKRGP